ncbi:hypothetical protein [Providencia sp. PROV255]|uniref:hypothetical protein n=1 Tax=Providencia sp. PROV255 TaxID=2949943 RepID=UPI00234B025C|nr:hypothetical protein [Providencia sp. PROV255]
MSTTERAPKRAPRRKKSARRKPKQKHWSYSITSMEFLIAFLLVLIVAGLSAIYYWRSTTLVTAWDVGTVTQPVMRAYNETGIGLKTDFVTTKGEFTVQLQIFPNPGLPLELRQYHRGNFKLCYLMGDYEYQTGNALCFDIPTSDGLTISSKL